MDDGISCFRHILPDEGSIFLCVRKPLPAVPGKGTAMFRLLFVR